MTNEDTQNWHRESVDSNGQTTVRQSRYQELAAWSDSQGVRDAFDLVYYGLCSSETLIGLGNVVQELSYPEAQPTLTGWSLHPAVSQLLKLSAAYKKSPAIAASYRMIPPSGSIGQSKTKLTSAGGDTQNRHFVLLLLVTPLVGDHDHRYQLRRAFRLWLLIQALERVVHQRCTADSRIRDSVNFILKAPHHENWVLLDALLQRTDQLLDDGPSFQQFSLALSQAAVQLALKSEKKGDRRFLNAVDFIAKGHCSPLDSHGSQPELELNFEALGVRQSTRPELELNGHHYQNLELPNDTESQDGDEDSDTAVFYEVDPTESPERQKLTGQSILVQSTELSHYLPWSWDKPLPPEIETLNAWIVRELQSEQPLMAMGAACTWLCSALSRSFPFLMEIQITESPSDEWSITPDFGLAQRLVPRRHHSWQPDAATLDLIEPFVDRFSVAIPDKISSALEIIRASVTVSPMSIGDLWFAVTTEKPEVWFNHQAKVHFPRLTSGKLANIRSQIAFNGSGDHSLARLIQAHPREALPAACGYQNWDIAQVERGFDLTTVQNTLPQTNNRLNLFGSLLSPLNAVLIDGIQAAKARLREAANSDLITYHNALARYCVMALYAATGCRHLKDPFESLDHFCDDPPCVFLNDKSDGGIHGGRLVPLPDKVMPILKAYLSHLERLAEKLEGSSKAFAERVRLLTQKAPHSLPMFFQLDSALTWHSMTSRGLPGASLFDWPLPPNLFRHRFAQQLARADVHPEVIDGWLGHAERGTASYGDNSPRCWLDDVNEYREVINRIYDELGFEVPDPQLCLPDPPCLPEPDATEQNQTTELFGQHERQRKRRDAISRAIRSARSDIKLLMGDRTIQDLDKVDVQNLERLMLLRENGLPHPQAAIRYSTLTKLFDRTGSSHRVGLKRRLAKMERERVLLSEQSVPSLRGWPLLASWLDEHLPRVQKAALSKTHGLIYAAVFLVLGKRLTYRQLIDDILTGTNFRLIQTEDSIFIEYNEELDPEDWSMPVQRHAIDYKTASLLAHGVGVKTTVDFDKQPCPAGLNSLIDILWPLQLSQNAQQKPCPVTVKALFDRLTDVVSQANLIQLPGVVSAALSERSPPTSPYILDYLRLKEGRVYQLPNTPDEPEDTDRAPSPVSRVVMTNVNSEALKERAKIFFQGMHDVLKRGPGQTLERRTKQKSQSRAKAPKKEKSVRLAREIERYCQEASGTVSSSILYVGYWLASRIRQGKGRPGHQHDPYATSSLHRYLTALVVPFQGLAYDVDITRLDHEAVTDLCHQMLELQKFNGRDLNYFGARLVEFMRWAQAHGVSSPLWEELDFGVARRTVAPGVLSEHDYIQCFRQILHSEHDSPDARIFVAFVLLAAYRFGLRAQEAIGLLRHDWCRASQFVWVLVQSNKYRGLKTSSSRRAVPLMFPLMEEEVHVIQRLLDRYTSKAADRTNLPILCELDGSELNLTTIHGSIPNAITRIIKSVTGNPTLSLHHARHSFYNRLAAALFGIQTPLANALSDPSQRPAIVQLILGDPCSLSRRSTMALARALGHSHPSTGFRHYNHLMTDWADSLTPLSGNRTRKLAAAIQIKDWPTRPAITQTVPESLFQFHPPSLSSLLAVLRLVSLGMSFTEAGDKISLAPNHVSELYRVMAVINGKHRFKILDPDSGKPALVSGQQLPSDELIKRLNSDAWLRLMSQAEYLDREFETFYDGLPELPHEEILELIGTGGHLIMYTQEQCLYIRRFLEHFAVPDDQYQVVTKSKCTADTDIIVERLSAAGFSVTDNALKSKELSKYLQNDRSVTFNTSGHGGLILTTSSKNCIRNRLELSVAFILMAVMYMYSTSESAPSVDQPPTQDGERQNSLTD